MAPATPSAGAPLMASVRIASQSSSTVAASLMGAGDVDCVVVGADRIAANGDVANKIGTYSLAVLAHAHGIPFRVLPDAAAGSLLARGEVDRIVVGADRIAANGDTANKIGTYPLAVLAQRHEVPFYVAAPLSTIDPATATGADIPIEERLPAEVTHIAGVGLTPEGAEALNLAFDVTPADLVTAIVTEAGVLEPPYEDSIARALAGDERRS